ncbi:MAG: polymer-forming cytoskeletal protein, partial [Rhodothermales bacterium]
MAKKARPLPPIQINIIAKGTVLEGTLYVKEDMRVSGRIVGTVTARKRVVVAPEGAIDGGIVAAVVDIAGSVHGDLDVAGHLILRSGARVEGTLKTGQFIVEEGAIFNGTCRMGQVVTPSQADEAPALPVDVQAEQREAASKKQVRPMQIPSSARWVFAPPKQSPATPDQDEAPPVQVDAPLQAEEAEIPVPPSPIDGSPQDRLHEDLRPKDDGMPARAGAKLWPSQSPETAGRERPEEQPSSTRRRPMILGFFLMIILVVSGYFGFARDTGEDGEPPSPAAASGDTLTDAPVVSTEAPLTEAASLPLEDPAEDGTDPPDEPAADDAGQPEQE